MLPYHLFHFLIILQNSIQQNYQQIKAKASFYTKCYSFGFIEVL